MNIQFSIIIPTFNRCKDLARLLMSLSSVKEELDGVEIVVADDGSFDDTEKVVRDWAASFERTAYFSQKNRGPAAARNLGAHKAKGEYLIFADDDCLFSKGCLTAIKDFYAEKGSFIGLGVKTINNSRSIFSEYNQRLGDYLIEVSLVAGEHYEYVSSRCYSFSRKAFGMIQGHDEDFIWPAAEDRDLCFRIKKRNMRVGYLQAPAVINTDHLRLGSFMKQNFIYGLGSGLFTQKHPGIAPVNLSRYEKMISSISRDSVLFKRGALLLTFLLAQFCFMAGLLFYKINYDHQKRPPAVFHPKHVVLVEMVKNFILGMPFVRFIKNLFGSSSTGEELYSASHLAFSAQKTNDLYNNVTGKEWGEKNWIEGKRVLEIGPGSHLSVSLSLIAQGASQVVAVDKYGEVKFREKESLICAKMFAQLSDEARRKGIPLLEKLTLEKIAGFDPKRSLNYLPDIPIDHSEILRRLPAGYFDLIVSFNTLEHVEDLNKAFRHMRILLNDGGAAIHRVDAGSHYAILRHSKNRLSQLLFSETCYKRMFSHRGAPTRRVLSEYVAIAREEGLLIKETCVDEVASDSELNGSLRFLNARFRDFSPEEIRKIGFILVAKK